MKVYLVDIDNGESYEDHYHSIDKVFTSYRGASQWLIGGGYQPYAERWFGEVKLEFYWEESDEYMASCSYAKIIEKEVEAN